MIASTSAAPNEMSAASHCTKVLKCTTSISAIGKKPATPSRISVACWVTAGAGQVPVIPRAATRKRTYDIESVSEASDEHTKGNAHPDDNVRPHGHRCSSHKTADECAQTQGETLEVGWVRLEGQPRGQHSPCMMLETSPLVLAAITLLLEKDREELTEPPIDTDHF